MRQVQEALKNIGIPVIAGIWRATSENQNPPLQYVVYSSTTTETAFQDDRPAGYRTWLMAWADTIEEIKTVCWCGRKATFNARVVTGK